MSVYEEDQMLAKYRLGLQAASPEGRAAHTREIVKAIHAELALPAAVPVSEPPIERKQR